MKARWYPVFLLILAAGFIMTVWFGTQKQGFHEDEIYSYYSSNRSVGITWPDRDWVDVQRLTDEMVVLPGERFRFGMVRTVQSWDVHPPMYYFMLHAVCSLFPGVFSKWLGIAVNLAAYMFAFLLLFAICRQCERTPRFTALFLLLWAIHPLNISGVMFIRMYAWLTVFVLACLYLHMRLLKGYTKLRMAAIMAVSFLGFLTHYYYVIFFFFTGVSICLMWFFQRTEDMSAANLSTRFSRIGRYVFLCAASLAAAILFYPAALSHILRGYRGKEAMQAFVTASGWGTRLSFFGGLINDFLFSGALPALLFLFLVLACAGGRKGNGFRSETILTAIPVACYFLTVSATALLLGESSNRYLMPVDPLIYLLVLSAGDELLHRLADNWKPASERKSSVFYWRIGTIALHVLFAGLLLFMDLKGLFVDDHVLFLYPENKALVAEAQDLKDSPVVVLYNEETPENVWRLYDKLSAFSEIYFIDSAVPGEEAVSAETGEAVLDERITGSQQLCLFAADTADNLDRNARIAEILRANPNLTEKQTIDRRDMWTWYRCY